MLYFLFIEFILLLVYIFLYNKIAKKYILILKIINSLLFLLLGLFLYIQKKRFDSIYYILILSALFCGFIGDIILGIRNMININKNKMFLIGLCFFMIGHLLYVSSMFMVFEGNVLVLLAIAFFLLIITICVCNKLRIDFGDAYILDYLYIFISSIFVSICFLNFILKNDVNYLIIFIGSVSFVTSDFILSYIYFGKNNENNIKIMKTINIATYYVGQIILALSIFLI